MNSHDVKCHDNEQEDEPEEYFYEVEKILGVKWLYIEGVWVQYFLVKWKGYDDPTVSKLQFFIKSFV